MSARIVQAAVGIAVMVCGGAVLLFALFNRGPEPSWIDVVAGVGVGIGLIGVGFRIFRASEFKSTKTE